MLRDHKKEVYTDCPILQMFRSIFVMVGFLSTTALFGTVSAFGNGPECQGIHGMEGIHGMGTGNCVKRSECTTNEWLYGKVTNPVCDEVGSDSSLSTTKVCCFNTPSVADDNTMKLL